MSRVYAIQETDDDSVWRCPGATREECEATALLWASWGIACIVVRVAR